MPWWSKNPCWDNNYDGESEPQNEQQSLTRNAETVADALTGRSQDEWNRGTFGDYDCDYSEAEHDFANAYGDPIRYYDQLNSADIEITILGEDDDDDDN